jgi:AcrR family transcriptional regulator
MATAKLNDHRSRVGAQRRQRTRMRLVESAMTVFAARGFEGSVIDDVITTAGVSRGTFYNYFRSSEELLAAVARQVGDEMLRIVDPVVRLETDPAVRVATGIRLVFGIARNYPQLAAFMVRGGPAAISTQGLATEYLPRDLADGVAAGRFTAMSPRLAFDLVTGAILAAFHSLLTAQVPDRYAEDMARMILQALGVPRRQATAIATRELSDPKVDRNSLLARAEARAATAAGRRRARRGGF